MTVLLGSIAAVLFGLGDVIAGAGGRRDGAADAPAAIAFVATIVGAILSGGYLLFFSDDSFVGNDLWWACAAGVIMSAARPLLYRGMAVGPIIVFAPVMALIALVVPAVLAPIIGQDLALLEVIGIAIALPAVVLVSGDKRLPSIDELRTSPVVGLGVIVGFCIGIGGLFLSLVSEDAGAAPAVVLTTLGIIVIPVVARVLGQSVRPNATTLTFGGIVGCTSVLAFILAALTYQRSNAAIGSALIGLSPGVSILIAWKFLGEKVFRLQVLGGILGGLVVLLFALAQ